jgi:spoIIIJ-associated protein
MDETCEQAGTFLQSILEKSGFALEVSVEQTADRCLLNLDGGDAELLQVEGGELLEALQHLVNQAFGRSLPAGQRIVCDVHGFRATREMELRKMALHAATQVRSTGAVFTFGSMTAQERRVIHVTLAESEDLLTESVGEGSERKLRVGLKKATRSL